MATTPPTPPLPVVSADGPPPQGLATVLRNAVASTMGASVVATVVTPLDVVKVRVQAHVCTVSGSTPCMDPHHVQNSLDAARKIVRADGVRGLWRGLNVTLLLAIPTTGLYFTLYEALRHRITPTDAPPSPAAALAAGAFARVATVTVVSPLELARTSLQAGAGGPHATVRSVWRSVSASHGWTALWRGLGPTLWRDVPFSAIYWSVYETLKDPARSPLPSTFFKRSDSSKNFPLYLAAGIGAGGLAAILTVPADVIKTRRQAMLVPSTAVSTTPHKAPPNSAPTTALGIGREIIAREGIRGLFRGAAPRVAKVAPSCAIMMSSFEFFRYLLGDTGSPCRQGGI